MSVYRKRYFMRQSGVKPFTATRWTCPADNLHNRRADQFKTKKNRLTRAGSFHWKPLGSVATTTLATGAIADVRALVAAVASWAVATCTAGSAAA